MVLEGDALRIINAINSSSLDVSMVRNYVEEAKMRKRDYQACSVKHIRRTANEATHVLAKKKSNRG